MPLLNYFIGYIAVRFVMMVAGYRTPPVVGPRATRQNFAIEPSSDQTEYSSTSS